ncbi:MAG: hypothetical protein JZU62_05955 [Sulfuricurvum sp.]|uniref:hypothetical protein n=1 Tax=Sulfuricurvum sp. TaxID=2025608 RepID=UPI0025F07E01|nr:hypothetical protein [Sulfuricurvum sp.]MBV5321209.1 hypothetical protein [Sulfuricurvum sp.]
MEVGTSGQMQQMQMRKMDGSGGGQNQNNGMKEMMQSLSSEDRTAVREQIANLSETDRKSMKDQISQIETASLSPEDLAQTMFDMLSTLQNPVSSTETDSSTSIDIYA